MPVSEKDERVVIIMKPDCVQRSLLGEIIHRFERKGLRIIGMKMVQLGDVTLEEHYAHHKEKNFFESLKKYMKSSPVVLIVLEGIKAISSVRMLVGPLAGHEAAPGTIRGDFSLALPTNIVHASDSAESAAAEVCRFFKDDELFSYRKPEHDYIYGDAR
ncbi:MAG: nucleoside-diphosphate kinase [Candidatus Vogelbacteria bacterium]|nr:nucleoside-diphosphate kinase [Candidatus Vogelbacteria bacterium]